MLKKLFDYVEIRTKVTTTGSFLLTLAYLFYIRQPVDWKLTVIFFVSMMTMDLSTTAINNYIDTKKSGQDLGFSRKAGLWIIIVLLTVSAAAGLYLVYLTDLVVLILGACCFIFGILYTWGPVTISRLPLGEFFSGVLQGFVGPFILLYICMPKGTYVDYSMDMTSIDISLMIVPLLSMILLTIAPVCTIADIMLANNVCDLDSDVENGRYTLAYYLKGKALYLFAGLYYCAYIGNVLMVVFGIATPLLLLSLITIVPVQRNINRFFRVHEKDKTFFYSIVNYLLIIGADIILLCAGRLTGS